MTKIEETFRSYFENNRTDDRELDLLHATDAVREYIANETNRQRISLPHWCNLAKLDQVFGNKGVFGRFCQELQDDLDAAKAKLAAEKEDPRLKEINDLKDELKRLANELAAVKEENKALKRENEDLQRRLTSETESYCRLEHRAEELSTMLLKESEEKERLEEQLHLSQSSVEGMKKSYNGVLHNLQLVYRRELPEAVTTVSNTLKEYSRKTGSVLRKGKTSKLADEILTYLRDDDHKWIEAGLLEANIFAAQEKMSNESEKEYEIRCQLLKDTNQADVMIGYLKRKTVKGPDGDIIEVPNCLN